MLENPRNCRTGAAPCAPTDVIEALYCAFHHAPNGKPTHQIATELASRFSRPLAYWVAAVDPLRRDRPFPVEAFGPLQTIAGTTAPLRLVAGGMRHGIFLLPSLDAAMTDINLRLLRVLKELGDVSVVLERIQADGRLDSAEGRDALEQLRELLEAVTALTATVAEASKEALPGRPAPLKARLQTTGTHTTRRPA